MSDEPTAASDIVARIIRKRGAALIARCREQLLKKPRLRKLLKQLRVSESDEWLREALSLFAMCARGCGGPAVEWHDEVGGLNFAAGLDMADANVILSVLRDALLDEICSGGIGEEASAHETRETVRAVLYAFDCALAIQANAYVRESQRHLNEINRRLEFRREIFERDLALASLVQQQFIPKGHESENFRAVVRYVPLSGVGGDSLGIFLVSRERIYVTIADVTGHGIAAALVAEAVRSQLRPLLRQQVDTTFQYGVEPVGIIRMLNSLFHDEFEPLGILLSFFVAVADCVAGTLTYAGAGHPPAMLQPAGKADLIELRSQNIILGATEDCVLGAGQNTLPLNRGDRIIFYTDGVIEASDQNGRMFGIDGLREAVVNHYDKPQEELADCIIGKAKQIAGPRKTDDMSLLLLDVLEK